MKLLLLSAIVAVCSALPQNYYGSYQDTRPRGAYEKNAAILRSSSDVNENGYQYLYETENGIQAQENGQEADGIQAQGVYSYTGDDGQVYSVRYTAGANGFEPQAAHFPTPPPIPTEIAKALEDNARDEANGIFDDGSYYAGKYDSSVTAVRQAAPAYRARPRLF